MPVGYRGRGNAERSMDLLWGRRPTPTRGPKRGLSVESIVRAAVELADAEGLEGLSMRHVAERLGVGTMSLYTYVPGRAELVDLMLDAVHGERMAGTEPTAAGSDWRARLDAMARDRWALHQRHPWTLRVASGRAVVGPNERDSHEAALAIVGELGLAAREEVAIVDSIAMYVRGAARAVSAESTARAPGTPGYEPWSESELLMRERFPTLARLDAEGGFDDLRFVFDEFEFGLQRLLDGIEAFVRGRAV